MSKSPVVLGNNQLAKFSDEHSFIVFIKDYISEYNFKTLMEFIQSNTIPENFKKCINQELYDLANNDLDLEQLMKVAHPEIQKIIRASFNNMAAGGHKIHRLEFLN